MIKICGALFFIAREVVWYRIFLQDKYPPVGCYSGRCVCAFENLFILIELPRQLYRKPDGGSDFPFSRMTMPSRMTAAEYFSKRVSAATGCSDQAYAELKLRNIPAGWFEITAHLHHP